LIQSLIRLLLAVLSEDDHSCQLPKHTAIVCFYQLSHLAANDEKLWYFRAMPQNIPQSIGKRIQQVRQQHNFTQQQVADRIAISRVAVSHIESDLSIPSERTVTLLAGLFKISPYELVAGTTYPVAKIERLPLTTACYTSLEVDLLLLDSDLSWFAKLTDPGDLAQARDWLWKKWVRKFEAWGETYLDSIEIALLAAGRERFAKELRP